MSIAVTGLPELEANILKLQAGLGADVGAAVGAGLAVMQSALLSASPPYGRAAIGSRFDGGGSYEVNAKTGIHVGKGNQGKNRAAGRSTRRRSRSNPWSHASSKAPHAHLIELGTAERWTRRGFYRGRVLPQPFVRRAESNASGRVLAAVEERIDVRLERWQ